MLDVNAAAANWGLPGLFVAATAAGSVFANPSEAVLAAVIATGKSALLCVAVATVGNVLGAATLFYLGRWAMAGGQGPVARWLEKRKSGQGAHLERAQGWLRRHGAPALVMSWMPILGDAFVLAAGAAGVTWRSFLVWVTVGKGLRYAVVAAGTSVALRAIH